MNRASTLIAAVFLTLAIGCSAVAQTPLTPEQMELVKAQIATQKAQAIYYQGQLELARKQAEANKPKPYKTIWDKYTNNDPADVFESVGVVFCIIVVLLILFTTYRAARRDQRDMRFYEALKRFGDAGSPALRSTAAGILAQMGREPAYFDTALDQLVSGLMLEEHPAVQTTIANAILGLARNDRQSVFARLQQAPPHARERVGSILGI